MGTQLSSILITKKSSIEELSGKKLVVDSYNMIYQFLSSIRQQDGSSLMDSQGNITSHLSGLFFRTTKLMKNNIKLAFVFDGEAPQLKKEEHERRAELKKEAQRKYELAVEKKDLELMKKYASRTSVLTKEMTEESKDLINAIGLPIIQAPSEGEAQAAHMAQKKEFFGLVSQDTDGLLFGSPRIIKNLSISGKRKIAGTTSYETIDPEIIDLDENLNNLGINNDQLIVIAMLCGTDFNIGGIKGIGPKKALDLVKKHRTKFDNLFKEEKWNQFFDYSWQKVFNTIKDMPFTDDYSLHWRQKDTRKIYEILVEKHDFSKNRIENALTEITKKQGQKGLGEFF